MQAQRSLCGLLVNGDAGEVFRLLLRQGGELRYDLSGVKHRLTCDAVAHVYRVAEQGPKFLQIKIGFLGKSRIGGGESRLQKQSVFLHNAGKK